MCMNINHVGFEIRCLENAVRHNLESRVKAEGVDDLPLMHGWIIRYLYENRNRDVFQKDIEKHFSIGRSTVTGIIQILESSGYIRREFVEYDARLKKVTLTPKGIRSHETIEAQIERLNQEMTLGISEQDLKTFLKVAGQIRANIDNEQTKKTQEEKGKKDLC